MVVRGVVLKTLAPLLFQVWGGTSSRDYRFRGRYFMLVNSLSSIRERNALVIGRAGMKVPPGWELIQLSNVSGSLGPRELPKLLELIARNFQETPDRPVVIACPEYIALHNGPEALLKFLNTVRDYAIASGGRVYLVTDGSIWSEREYALLKLLET